MKKESNRVGTGDYSDALYGCSYTIKHSQLRMELNMNDKTIRYYVDGLDQGIAFDDICFDDDQQYSMFVCLDDELFVKLIFNIYSNDRMKINYLGCGVNASYPHLSLPAPDYQSVKLRIFVTLNVLPHS